MKVNRPSGFRHGVHPAESKEPTCGSPIRRLPFPSQVVLPLSQHIGAPSVPVVAAGDVVRRGQLIARPLKWVSVGLHAPVAGRVLEIGLRLHPNGQRMPAIVIESDPTDSQRWSKDPSWPSFEELTTDDWLLRIQEAGLVGLGGAAFPSHVKLVAPKGKRISFVVLNGCECEPYLTCDHRLMLEYPAQTLRGLRLAMSLSGAKRGYIGVESNKEDAILALRAELADDPAIEVIGLTVKYPQGAERMLLKALFEREVPAGGYPVDLDMMVLNVGSAVVLAEIVDLGKPLIERVVTVSGPAVRRPGNWLVPIGTSVREVFEACGGLTDEARGIVMGGPMMGVAQPSLDVPVLKGTSGLLAFSEPELQSAEELACIRCARCLEACPMFLNPSRLSQLVRVAMIDELKVHHLASCFECASCSFVCPSNIPLVQLLRMGKVLLRQHKES